MSGPPGICVFVTTYRHAAFIRQALDSALAQETESPPRIVVHDDASDDGTREIVEAYAKAHPDRIEAILQDENQFRKGLRSYSFIWPRLSGDYVAALDGDDVWTDRRKLARQAAFLDANPGCVLVQTAARHVDAATGEVVRRVPPPKRRRRRLELDHLAQRNFVQTSAAMFRRAALPELPPGFETLPFGDWALFALLARRGWIGLVDEEMADCRIHGGNWMHGRTADYVAPRERAVRDFVIRHLDPCDRAPWEEARDGRRAPLATRLRRRARNRLRALAGP